VALKLHHPPVRTSIWTIESRLERNWRPHLVWIPYS